MPQLSGMLKWSLSRLPLQGSNPAQDIFVGLFFVFIVTYVYWKKNPSQWDGNLKKVNKTSDPNTQLDIFLTSLDFFMLAHCQGASFTIH